MSLYCEMLKNELEAEHLKLQNEYENFKNMNLKLNMSRGKPSPEQLELSSKMITDISYDQLIKTTDGFDARNYGMLSGTLEAKKFFSNILNVPTDQIIIGGNSSLNLMYNYIDMAMQFGVLGNTAWNKLENIKFLCPVPGYDRHFAICELFNIEMINIDMNSNGPDMQKIKHLVETDPSVKGIWCVPQYSNPSGITYSDEVVNAFAALKPAAADFRIFWDNAYIVHHINEEKDHVLNIFDACKQYGSENMVIEFTSTSKITFPGAGISAVAASKANIEDILHVMSKQIISHDKMNQLRHCLFLSSPSKLEDHMTAHAKILKPKFDLVIKKLKQNLSPLGIGNWTEPNGGYFISFNAPSGCAKRIYELCKEAGVTLTNIGATYPYGKDPENSNIRIAPTFPNISELETAIDVFCICVKLASVEKFLQK